MLLYFSDCRSSSLTSTRLSSIILTAIFQSLETREGMVVGWGIGFGRDAGDGGAELGIGVEGANSISQSRKKNLRRLLARIESGAQLSQKADSKKIPTDWLSSRNRCWRLGINPFVLLHLNRTQISSFKDLKSLEISENRPNWAKSKGGSTWNFSTGHFQNN